MRTGLNSRGRPDEERQILVATLRDEHIMDFLDRNTEAKGLVCTDDEVFGVNFHVLPTFLLYHVHQQLCTRKVPFTS